MSLHTLVLSIAVWTVATAFTAQELANLPSLQLASDHLQQFRRGDKHGAQPVVPLAQRQNYTFTDSSRKHADLQMWSLNSPTKFFACLTPKCGSTEWTLVLRNVVAPYEPSAATTNIGALNKHIPVNGGVVTNSNMYPYGNGGPGSDDAFTASSVCKYRHYPEKGLMLRPQIQNARIPLPVREHCEQLAQRIINDPAYFKFAIVRHPWERLVSAFRHRYIDICEGDRYCFLSRHNLTHTSLGGQAETDPVDFHEFVREIHAGYKRGEFLNSHFRPAASLCEVDRIHYDYIGELDNLREMDFLALKVGSPLAFTDSPRAPSNKASKEPRAFPCSVETVELAESLYREDLVAFGYSMDRARESCRLYGMSSPPSA